MRTVDLVANRFYARAVRGRHYKGWCLIEPLFSTEYIRCRSRDSETSDVIGFCGVNAFSLLTSEFLKITVQENKKKYRVLQH